ncbi:hypothetical protein FACS1894104_4950 [Actinomycetota bacterium]|nr:hypothetical protein FACS1894104_4950 [Actinomycetota bacterium]
MWIANSAKSEGIAHTREGISCQDAVYFATNGLVNAGALCDGAGTAKHAEIGAQTTAEVVVHELLDHFDSYLLQHPNWLQKLLQKLLSKQLHTEEAIKQTLIQTIQSALIDRAHNFPDSKLDDYHSTLLAVAIKNDKFIAFHIGDGVIGCRENGQLRTMSQPDNGEYASSTFFVTLPHAEQYLRYYHGHVGDINGFVLISDGTAESFYDQESQTLAKVCIKLLDENAKNEAGFADELQESFDSVVRNKTTDDCSVVLMGRAE